MNRLALILLAAGISPAGDVTTYAYDNLQSGHNDAEPVLTRALVSGGRFHKLGTWSLGSSLHCPTTQPLVKTGVTTGSGVKDIVVEAALDGNVFAFDANSPGATIWTHNYGAYPANLALEDDWYNNSCTLTGGNMGNGLADIGIASTGVLSGTTWIFTNLDVNGVLWLNYVNLADGTNVLSPVQIAATSGSVVFNPALNFQHAALKLYNGTVYFSTSSMGERDPWAGWVFGYSATTGAQTFAWPATADNDGRAGMWMSGAGATIDGSGNIYEVSGNGRITLNNGCGDGVTEYGQSVIKLNASLLPQAFFSPTCSTVNTGDNDMGTSKLTLIPSTNFAILGSKNSIVRVVNVTSLGGANASPSQSWVDTTQTTSFRIAAGLIYVSAINKLFVNSFGGKINAYTWGGSSFTTTPAYSSADTFPQSGVAFAYSSNNEAAGSQILWANACTKTVSATNGCTRVTAQPGTLYAYNPNDLTILFSSDTLASDALGNSTKYMPPTVVNGKVYVPTLSGTLAVFGIVPSVSGAVTLGGKVTVQ